MVRSRNRDEKLGSCLSGDDADSSSGEEHHYSQLEIYLPKLDQNDLEEAPVQLSMSGVVSEGHLAADAQSPLIEMSDIQIRDLEDSRQDSEEVAQSKLDSLDLDDGSAGRKHKKASKSFDSESEDSGSSINTEEAERELKKEFPNLVEDLEKSLSDSAVNVRGVGLSIIFSAIFLACILLINNVSNIAWISKALRHALEEENFTFKPDKSFYDISSEKDLDKYMRYVMIPYVYTTSNIVSYNNLIGLRFTLKRALLDENEDDDFETIAPYVRENPEIEYTKYNEGEDTRDLGIWEYERNGGYNNAGGYVDYFINLTYNEALYKWRNIRSLWLVESKFATMTMEIMFQNRNIAATLYYHQIYKRQSSGTLLVESGTSGIFPENFEQMNQTTITLVALIIIYLCGLVLQIIKLFQNLYRAFNGLITKGKLDIVWHEYIEILSIVLVLTSISLCGEIVLGFVGKFKLPIETNDDLDALINYAINFRSFVRVTAITTILIAFKVILVLKNKYPSFGVLFDTIRGAKSDIFNFGLIVILLMSAFVMTGHLAFGNSSKSFSTVDESYMTLFEMILGNTTIDYLGNESAVFARFYFLIFMSLFYFIMLNMFLAIVIATYSDIRQRNQKLLEAKADLAAKDANLAKQRWLNLIFFRYPSRNLEASARRYLELTGIVTNDPAVQEDINDELKELENALLKHTTPSWISTLKYNIGQLSPLANVEILQTREQYVQKLYATAVSIQKNKMNKARKRRRLEKKVSYNYKLVKEMLIYLAFIIVFIVSLLLRLNIIQRYYMQETILREFKYKEFDYNGNSYTIADVNNKPLAFHYMKEIALKTFSEEVFSYQFDCLSKPVSRLTFRKAKLEPNDSFSTKEAIPFYRAADEEQLTSRWVGASSNRTYEYTSPGDLKTFGQLGGYVINFDKNYTANEELILEIINDIESKDLMDVSLEFVMYNANYNLFAYNYVRYFNWPAGNSETIAYSNCIQMDMYSSDNISSALFEILYALFTLYYIYVKVEQWIKCWKHVVYNRKVKKQGEEALVIVMEKFRKTSSESAKGCDGLLSSIYAMIKKYVILVFQFLYMILEATYTLLKKDLFNFIDILSLALSLGMFAILLTMFNNDFRKNYELPGDWEDYIGEFAVLDYDMVVFKNMAAYNSLLIFARLQQYFKFSKELSLLSDILESAKLDIVFFLLMFAIILFAYAMMGYMLLGHFDTDYEAIGNSVISCYSMLVGKFAPASIRQADSILGTIFFVTFMILFNLLLLNMFIAIIGAHFDQIKSQEDKTSSVNGLGFFSKIVDVFRRKRKGMRYMEDAPILPAAKTDILTEENIFIDGDNSFIVPQAKMLMTSPSTWMKYLEDKLLEKSIGKLRLPQFKIVGSQHTTERETFMADMSSYAGICYLNLEMWRNDKVEQKLQTWRQLQIAHEEYTKKQDERGLQNSGRKVNHRILSDLQIKLWDATPFEEQIEMWIGKKCFNESERVAVWNNVCFSPRPAGKSSWTVTEQAEYWSSLDHRGKTEFIKALLEPALWHIQEIEKKREKAVKFLIKSRVSNDMRLNLWLGLTNQDKSSMYLNQVDDAEAEIIAYLIMHEKEGNVFSLDLADTELGQLLDCKLYDKCNELSMWQADYMTVKELETEEMRFESEARNLEEYRDYLDQNINQMEAMIRKYLS